MEKIRYTRFFAGLMVLISIIVVSCNTASTDGSRKALFTLLDARQTHIQFVNQASNFMNQASNRSLLGAPLEEATSTAAPVRPALAPPRLAGAPAIAAVRTAVTELAEYARCPRRHHLGRVLGVTEPRGGQRGAAADDPGRATARGRRRCLEGQSGKITVPKIASA